MSDTAYVKAVFTIGALMFGWDIAGHFCCLLARIGGPRAAQVWNNHSQKIWPSLDGVAYDAFWTVWHGSALFLMTTTFMIALRRRTP